MALTSMWLYPMIIKIITDMIIFIHWKQFIIVQGHCNNLKRIPNEEKIAKSAINVINHKFASADETIWNAK